MSTVTLGAAARTTKVLSIGRAWVNENPTGRQALISGQIDRDLGATILLGANDRIMFFRNEKREGKKDADFRIAIELPIAEADTIINAKLSRNAPTDGAHMDNAALAALASLNMPH